MSSLAGRWKDLGTSLGIRTSDLDEIVLANPHFPRDCLREMLTKWLKRNHNVRTHPLCLIYYTTLLEKLPLFPGGEVWDTNLEKTSGSCKGWCGGQQPSSGPEDSRGTPWWVFISLILYKSLFKVYCIFGIPIHATESWVLGMRLVDIVCGACLRRNWAIRLQACNM